MSKAPKPKREELPVKIVFNPFAITAALATAQNEQRALAGCTIEDDADARSANTELRLRATELAAVEAMWKATKEPIKEAEKRIDALFKPGIDAARLVVTTLRNLLEGYEKLKREAQRKAFAAAGAAATQASPAALNTALAAAADAAPTELDGTSFVRTWKIKRIVEGLLPFSHSNSERHYWVPDLKKIAAVGRAHKGDEPPIIPGVVWEEDLSSRVQKIKPCLSG